MLVLSFIATKKYPKVTVEPGNSVGECLAFKRLSLSENGLELAAVPAGFARFALEANVGEAAGSPGGWEDAVGKILAVSVLVHVEGKVLVLRRRGNLAIQSGEYTASIAGTVTTRDTESGNALAVAALRELQEETGLSETSGTLTFRGLALAPGKAQPVGLFEFSCHDRPDEVLRSVLAWPWFAEEHEGVEFLDLTATFDRPLSPISRFAVELFRHNVEIRLVARTAGYNGHIREKEALRRLAAIDPLTGLLNRLGFRKRMEDVLKKNNRAAVVVFDVDGLKLVNDRYGHHAGDEMLCLFAIVLSEAARRWPGAVAARTGGDEFAVLLPGSGPAEAEKFARSVADDARLETAPAARFSPCGAVRASWGTAVFLDDTVDPEGFLAAADARLRESKGRRKSFALALATVLSRFGENLSLDEAEAVFDAVFALADRFAPGLKAHSERVSRLARSVAGKMSLSPEYTRLAELAGKFHDIGKLGVGLAVLKKEEPLAADERILVERHPLLGAEMLGSVRAMDLVAEAVKYHHERWDGSGYPDGLKGEEIPLLARVVAACEAFDAACEHLSPGNALVEMRSSGEFDPVVLDALGKAFKEGMDGCAEN